jgi:hypothetical protein
LLELAARILLRYTKAGQQADCRINVRQNGAESFLTINNSLTPSDVERYIVA